ncbi:leucyl/phenylalanyl-tRNA--protein transferase [Sphingomonas sp. DT-204]|uniref:leucyl/phenylalanyl-tRNA--protein transferase n=1 Tax=Sphingomonas sp. DT-204 TaxID=3396166 RepID=UPI003F1B3E87
MSVFPMADSRDAEGVYWVEPKQRAVLPLDRFHLSRSLRKTIAHDRFRVTSDTAFEGVIALCAEPTGDREDTWINPSIEEVFVTLHERGFAHSVEVWDGERLAGGLYGLALGRAFFGESMVSRARDASKVALAWLVARLRVGGFTLLDCQFQTEHLASLGAIEVPRSHYNALLGSALGASAGGLAAGVPSVDGDWGALDALRVRRSPPPPEGVGENVTVSGPVAGKDIVQLLGHTS